MGDNHWSWMAKGSATENLTYYQKPAYIPDYIPNSHLTPFNGELAMMAVEYFLRFLMHFSEKGKPLYAIAVTKWNGKCWLPSGFEYVHASDEIEARLKFFQGNNPHKVKATWVAPVVGYIEEEDANGKTFFRV